MEEINKNGCLFAVDCIADPHLPLLCTITDVNGNVCQVRAKIVTRNDSKKISFEHKVKLATDSGVRSSATMQITDEQAEKIISACESYNSEKNALKAVDKIADMYEIITTFTSWVVNVEPIEDEGGKTACAYHTFCIAGRELCFTERNLYNEGVIINSAYAVDESDDAVVESAGSWMKQTDKGWVIVRELNEFESSCIQAIKKFGYFAGMPVRMEKEKSKS